MHQLPSIFFLMILTISSIYFNCFWEKQFSDFVYLVLDRITCTYATLYVTSPPRADPHFLIYFTGKSGPSIFKWSTLGMWSADWNVWGFDHERLSFIYKMIWEVTSVPRVDADYPYNFSVNSWVFKDDEPKTDAITNDEHQVCPLLVRSPSLAYTEHAQSPLLACRVRNHLLLTLFNVQFLFVGYNSKSG